MGTTIEDKYSDYFDVKDKCNFRKYREKMAEWNDGLSNSANPNSVFARYFELLKYHYLYKTIRKLYERAQDNPNAELGFNVGITGLIETGYVHLLTIAIRSLIEPQHSDPKKKINSLRSIVDDIEHNSHLITRECYLAIGNLPYNVQNAKHAYDEIISKKLNEYSSERISVSGYALPPKGPFAYQESEERHELFDRISGNSFDNRNRNDTIRPDIFRQLRDRLGSCSCVKDFVNDNFAHFSIMTPENKQDSLQFDRVEKCIEDLFRIYNYVNENLLGRGKTSTSFILPIDKWKNIDKKWALTEQDAKDIYNDIEAEMKKKLKDLKI